MKIGRSRAQSARKERLTACDRICWAERRKDEYIVTALRRAGWRAV